MKHFCFCAKCIIVFLSIYLLIPTSLGFRTTTTEDERPGNSLFTPVRLPGVQLPEVRT